MADVTCVLCLQGIVVDVRPFAAFIEFDVEAENGDKQPVYGMVHKSEISWEAVEDVRLVLRVSFFTRTAVNHFSL